MTLTQTEYGKAYEFACLIALRERLLTLSAQVRVDETDAYRTARDAFNHAEREGVADNLLRAACAAARVIFRLEPQLEFGNGILTLVIQTDAQGMAGDVRDVVCIRGANGWMIGLSCKHNHYAVKHSRLSATIDFGQEWLGIPCSTHYFNEVIPLFTDLKHMRDNAIASGEEVPKWREIPDKAGRYYVPLLNAFLTELRRLTDGNAAVPERLIRYMLGRYDFYKVITDDAHETTKVEAVNIAGTLNRPANGHQSLVDVARLRMPTRIYHMGMVPNSDNTVEIVCDEGWTLTMRIHNASSKVEPSLKFDVQLVSLPQALFSHTEPW